MRVGIDEIGRKYAIPLHATGLGHLYGMHWGPERVVDHRTHMLEDMEKIANIMLGLLNEGAYQYAFGTLCSAPATAMRRSMSSFAKLDRALHAVDLV